jgi:acyl-CoA thioester hydrolase
MATFRRNLSKVRMTKSVKPDIESIKNFSHFQKIPTRWMDNDVYQHVNNVVYYSFFDTAVNQYLIEAGVLDIEKSEVIGLVVETQCNYFQPIKFPDEVTVGIRVDKLGTSSVRYAIGVFKGAETAASAQGHFVHVYVNKATMKPAPIVGKLLLALQDLVR